jgi:superfamily II DNA or RNA helicase
MGKEIKDIEFKLHKKQNIQVNGGDRGYVRSVEEMLTQYVKNYMYTPSFKKGIWDGKISLFNRAFRSFPYGLFLDVLKHTKKEFSDVTYHIDPEIKKLFSGIPINDIDYNLALTPYSYQKECIEASLKASKGINIVATAGGKSLIITYIIDIINNNTPDNKSMIIVPTLQLVNQFKDDMIEYGIDGDTIGMVNSSLKEFDKDIIVSTWQSLQNQTEILPELDTVIVDEVHTSAALVLREILQGCINASFKIGMTGTMPTNKLDELNVMSYLGPVLKTFRGRDIADMGYISKCVVKMVYVEYNEEPTGDYLAVRDDVFIKEYRIGLINHIVQNTKNSILILIEKVEKEGEVLEEFLTESFPDKTVVFLSGRDSAKKRDMYRNEMNDRDDMIVIATYPIFQQGVNIKSLRTIILASPTKSFVRVIQSLGRVLRKHVSKDVGGAELYDICDECKYLRDHAEKRERHYTKERHDIIEFKLRESDGVYVME